jgi:hypothetical protein
VDGYLPPMNQDVVSPATAEKRSRRHALRPWLLLGGFVAVWWILSTGTAQADSAPRLHLHVAESASGLKHAAPVKHLADRGHQVTRKATHHAATPVRDDTKTISHATRTTVQATTTSIDEVAHGQAPTIVALPVTKLVDTAHNTVGDAVPSMVKLSESSTTQGDSASNRSTAKTATETFSTAVSSTSKSFFDDTLEVFPIAFAGRTAGALGQPFQAPASAPGQSPVSVSLALSFLLLIGLAGAFSLRNRSALQRSRMWRLARLPGGASYDPGSSPD